MEISRKKLKIIVIVFVIGVLLISGLALYLTTTPNISILKSNAGEIQACYWIDATQGKSCSTSKTSDGRSFSIEENASKLKIICSTNKTAVSEQRIGTGADTKECLEKYSSSCNKQGEKIVYEKPNSCVCQRLTTLEPCTTSGITLDKELQCSGIEILTEANQLLSEGNFGYLKDQLNIKIYYKKPTGPGT
jgi:hypothetical protein